jgi:transcription initiation factor IIE alpha subunit
VNRETRMTGDLLDALYEHGPQTARQIAERTSYNLTVVRNELSALKSISAVMPAERLKRGKHTTTVWALTPEMLS